MADGYVMQIDCIDISSAGVSDIFLGVVAITPQDTVRCARSKSSKTFPAAASTSTRSAASGNVFAALNMADSELMPSQRRLLDRYARRVD